MGIIYKNTNQNTLRYYKEKLRIKQIKYFLLTRKI